MRRSLRVAILALLGVSLAPALLRSQSADDPPPLSNGRVAGQVALGAVMTPVAFFGAGWLADHVATRRGASEEGSSRAGYVTAYTASWLAAAAGPTLVGRDGRFPAALGGSLAGFGAAFLTVKLGNFIWDRDRRECGVACWTLGAVTVALPSIGATIAYNASRR